jgi:hypothetical protein
MSLVQFAIVCHGGPIETQALLCLKSLFIHQRNIHSVKVFYPRELPTISESTKAFMTRYNTEIVEFSNEFLSGIIDPFSPENKRFLVANKIWCLEGLVPNIPRVVMDCDVLVLSDISGAFDSVKADIAASPTFVETLGHQYRNLFQSFGVPLPDERIQTVLTREPTPPYFNGGFVMVRSANRLFESWLALFRKMKDRGDLIENLYHTDQISLALSVLSEGYTYHLWPQNINVPLGFLDYRRHMKVLHWFNLEVLRQQHALTPAFREVIAPVVYSLRDQDGIDLTRAILRKHASLRQRMWHVGHEFARRGRWQAKSLQYFRPF